MVEGKPDGDRNGSVVALGGGWRRRVENVIAFARDEF
jgi:hypothetical protein